MSSAGCGCGGGGAGGRYLPGHSFLPTSPILPATFDLASRTHGGLAQGQGGDAKGIQRRSAAASSAPGARCESAGRAARPYLRGGRSGRAPTHAASLGSQPLPRARDL
ncbi:uncharacterized protein WM277_001309 [Molossus nigricans]